MAPLSLLLRRLFTICFLAAALARPGAAGDCNQNGVEDLIDLTPEGLGFEPMVIPALSFRPMAVVASDLDGDGDLDFATASTASSPGAVSLASVLRNGGRGSFSVPESFTVGKSAAALAAADLEGDGTVELAVASGFDLHLLTYRPGAGLGFREALPQGAPAVAILSADLDGDRDPDLATANAIPGGEFPDNVSIFLNAGGRLPPGRNYGVGRGPRSISAADFDRDGDLDLLTADAESQTLSVLSNDGKGVFGAPLRLELGSRPSAAIAADFDADGSPDLLAAASRLPLFLNRGDGAFGQAVMISNEAEVPGSLAAGDLDRDGDQDLILGCHPVPRVVVLNNDAPGSFFVEATYRTGSFPKTSLATGDLDGDGDLDVAAAGGVLSLLFNLDPLFDSVEVFTAGSNPNAIAAADFDADGRLDLAVADSVSDRSGSVSVIYNEGGGALQPAPALRVGPFPYRLLAADLDADADPDLAVTTSGLLEVKLNAGGRNFTGVETAIGGNLTSLAAGDLDGDGRNEILVGVENDGVVVLALNPSGELERRQVIQLGQLKLLPYFMVVANLDGDPAPEIAVVTGDTHRLMILWNDGQGGFAQTSTFAAGEYPFWVDAVDVDQEGDRDLVLLTWGTSLTVFFNRGERNFSQKKVFPTGPNSTTAAACDLDGDGDVDVAVDGDILAAHFDRGLGDFNGAALTIADAQGSFDLDLACGDVDGDRFADVISARRSAGPGAISVFRNTSRPPFSQDRNRNRIPDECEQGAFRRGDVVRDGALDLTDVVSVLDFLFLGGAIPACPDAADADDDGRLGLTDPIRVLGSLFLGDGPLPPPQACGLDPTADAFPACPAGGEC